MLTFLRKPRLTGRSSERRRLARRLAGGEDGFLLIEVVVSALMLGLIAVATITGLQAVNASDANERFHNEAVLLAAQSQEELRSAPVSSLEKLIVNSHTYTQTIAGTKYTITQKAQELGGNGNTTTCSVVEHGSYVAPNFRISSTVNWTYLKTGHPVVESSIITPPTSSSLEVDVGNAPTPTAGVSGVTVIVTYTAFETGGTVKLEGTTGSQGCVLFPGIRATIVNVEVAEKPNFVTPSGALKVPSSEVSVAPNITTRDQVTYDEGGAINATFAYEGKTTALGKKVTGDTFVVSNGEMSLSPELEVGTAGNFTYETGGEQHYTAETGAYGAAGNTAKGTRYEHGDLFPFPSSWVVFAGDCAANDPLVATNKAVAPAEAVVTAGNETNVSVPMSYVNLEALVGSEAKPTSTLVTAVHYPAIITDTSCSAASPAPATPNNAAAVSYRHAQTVSAGVLEDPFQPFGKFEICLQSVESKTNPSEDRVDRYSYSNSTVAGSHIKLFPEEQSAEEKTKVRETKENAIKEAGKEEEKTRKSDETEEASKRSTWSTEEKQGKITEAKRKEKEATQTTERKARETKEKENETKRNTELSELSTQKTKEATEASEKSSKASKGEAQSVESGSSAKC